VQRWVILIAVAAMTLGACTAKGGGASGTGTTPATAAASSSASPAQGAAPAGTIAFEKAISGTDGDKRSFTIDTNGTHLQQHRGHSCYPRTSSHSNVDPRHPNDGTCIIGTNVGLGGDPVSPDGSRIALEGYDDANASLNGIYTYRSKDGGGLVRVTASPAGRHDFPIAYSPDGSRILFLRPADATNDDHADMNMFVVNTDGTGLTRLNPPGTATGLIDDPIVSAQSWSPSGKQVAFVAAQGSFATDPRAVYVVDGDGSHAHEVAESTFTAVWSPDGRWIALDQPDLGSRDLFLVHPDGTGLKAITSAADGSFSFGPVWSPDGQWLLFVRGTGDGLGHTNLWIENVDGTDPAQITHSQGQYGPYGWGPRS
jgi:Tol biopolymer transport system component